MHSSINTCQACGAAALREVDVFGLLPRVTSDSKPYQQGGKLFVCECCALVQKIADAQWLREAGEIYRDYEMYHQSGSNDQTVFDPVSGQPSGRCEVLSRHLRASDALPLSGMLLDVGAGGGAMLGAFSAVYDGWRLFGLDLDDRKEKALRSIPRFEKLFTTPPEQLPQQFDLISLIHSLEHFTDPLSMLPILRGKLAKDGRLLIQVNNVARMPFDLIVADHLCHFTPSSLAYLVERAGFKIEFARTDWINKEITLLAVVGSQTPTSMHDDPREIMQSTEGSVVWLKNMLDHARSYARGGELGIFGTSVAATWLAGGLGDAVTFFVDEDPAREGRTHLARPILKPAQVTPGAVVYLAFVHEVATTISRRLANSPAKFAVLPESG